MSYSDDTTNQLELSRCKKSNKSELYILTKPYKSALVQSYPFYNTHINEPTNGGKNF